jgi:hypothetical protein
MLMPPGPASAGGPTSALLSVPGEGRTASLYYTDPAYDRLASLVGVAGSGTNDPAAKGHETGTAVTVTWLIHDVTPWRVDRIYLGGTDGPWIATQETLTDTGSIWDSPVEWHQPANGKELTQLLNSLGVGVKGAVGGADPGTAEQGFPIEPAGAVPDSVEPTSAAPTPTGGQSDSSTPDRAWWGLGGLAAGVLLAAGWTRVRAARTERRDDGWDPAAEDLDADPAKEWLTSAGR